MTDTQKSYIQVASNSLTLDDISELIEKSKQEAQLPPPPAKVQAASNSLTLDDISELIEKAKQETIANQTSVNQPKEQLVEPSVESAPPSNDQYLTAPEVYSQVQANVEPSDVPVQQDDQAEVEICSVPLIRSSVISTSRPDPPEDKTTISFKEALKRSQSDPARASASQESAENESLVSRLTRPVASVQRVPFVGKSQSRSAAEQLGASADIQERPEDWLPDLQDNPKRSTVESVVFSDTLTLPQSNSGQNASAEFAEQVLEMFPLAASCVLLVADVGETTNGGTVASNLARELASQRVGRILLVDSHFEKRTLTQELAPKSDLGFADVLSMDRGLDEALLESDVAQLDFLPAGTPIMCRRRDQQQQGVARLVRQFKNDYQFTIVSVGSAFEHAAKVWARQTEATYVTVGMNQTNRTVAQTGVQLLREHGARLMGCVVTDAAA